LEFRGHKIIEMRRTAFWEEIILIVNDEIVFKTKIQLLDFGGDGELDKIVQQAENAVQNAY
jgi:hypothetical protein